MLKVKALIAALLTVTLCVDPQLSARGSEADLGRVVCSNNYVTFTDLRQGKVSSNATIRKKNVVAVFDRVSEPPKYYERYSMVVMNLETNGTPFTLYFSKHTYDAILYCLD